MSDEMPGGNGAAHSRLAEIDVDAASQNVPKCPAGAVGNLSRSAQVSAGLSDAQLKAIELLICGTSFTKVAEACGVDRRTIHRWRSEDGEFIAELEGRRKEVWSVAADRMRAMVATSLRVLNDQLYEQYADRPHAAATVLRLANVRKLIEAEMASGGE